MVGVEFKQIMGSHGLRTIDGAVVGNEYLSDEVTDITFSFFRCYHRM